MLTRWPGFTPHPIVTQLSLAMAAMAGSLQTVILIISIKAAWCWKRAIVSQHCCNNHSAQATSIMGEKIASVLACRHSQAAWFWFQPSVLSCPGIPCHMTDQISWCAMFGRFGVWRRPKQKNKYVTDNIIHTCHLAQLAYPSVLLSIQPSYGSLILLQGQKIKIWKHIATIS